MRGITPHYKRAKVLAAEEWQGYTVELLGNIEAAGTVRYRFLLVVRGLHDGHMLWVSSERSRLLRSGASQGFFLGLFSDGRHFNLGQSKDWSDRRLFLLKAMTLAREALGRPVVLWPPLKMEKSALAELWSEGAAYGPGCAAREYLGHYDGGLPPMMSRRTGAA